MSITAFQSSVPDARIPLLDRQAVRFLFANRFGRLLTEDPITGEPQATPVHYVPEGAGNLLIYLPAAGEHAGAIRRGGDSLLSVESSRARVPRRLLDTDGQPTAAAVWHVQADVDAEVLDDPEAVAHVLDRQTETSSDRRGDAPFPSGLVAVRLRLIELRPRLHRLPV